MELGKVKISSTCNKCNSLKLKIVKLNQVTFKYEKDQLDLDSVLSKQIYTNDTSELGYSKFDQPSSSTKDHFC